MKLYYLNKKKQLLIFEKKILRTFELVGIMNNDTFFWKKNDKFPRYIVREIRKNFSKLVSTDKISSVGMSD